MTEHARAEGASPTRRRVIELLALGTPVREIAERLGISTQRVYQHRKAIRKAKAS